MCILTFGKRPGFIISLICVAIFSSLNAAAQPKPMSSADRDRWLSEIRNYKHEYLTRELALNKEQQRDFFPLYDAMEDEVERINAESRVLEMKAEENKDASDLELENTARTLFEQKRAEGQIEMTYFEKFKDILTPRQLVKLPSVERRFTQRLVNHRRKAQHAPHNNSQRKNEN